MLPEAKSESVAPPDIFGERWVGCVEEAIACGIIGLVGSAFSFAVTMHASIRFERFGTVIFIMVRFFKRER